MAKLDDWDSLMNGAFGRKGAKPAPSTSVTLEIDGTRMEVPARTAASSAATPTTASTAAVEDPFSALTAALAAQQESLNAQLKAQQEMINSRSALPDLANAATQAVDSTAGDTHAQTAAMLAALEEDGLLATGTSAVPAAHQGSFEGLSEELKEIVLGQDAFVDSLVRAMRRPFVLGTEPPNARNVVLISGGEGTGRHFALPPLIEKMAARGLLKNATIFTLDLSLYADSGSEKIFLQDLYAALHANGEIVVFEGYEQCHPSFLKTLAALATTGSAPLSNRYILNKEGILIDAGSALAPGAIRALNPDGNYLFFYSKKGKASIADHFGAGMLSAVGDFCTTAPFAKEPLAQIAETHLAKLTEKAAKNLGFTLAHDESVRDYIAAQAHEASGANGILAACDKIYRALSEYCLAQDALPEGTLTLSVTENTLQFALNDAAPAPLLDLLPGEYTGSRATTEAALDALVGLDSVKDYVRALADNLEVQKRRSAAGMKNASLSMHMIFSGNPGTGKTTIARLIAQYLKAIGALRGGQLIEVSRGDLVGRYSGHTAPLTSNVIESALGGVLFIDEAYSLYRGEQDSFGLEAIDTLVKGMEDHRDDLVVVLAGYTNEMNTFLTANSGLASRFSNNIEFPDYTAQELLAITKLQTTGKGYALDADCDSPLLAYYGAEQALHADTAGNGRLARNTLEKAILNQSKRLIATPDAPLDLLLAGDFELELPPIPATEFDDALRADFGSALDEVFGSSAPSEAIVEGETTVPHTQE
ncbi:MAG: AAA family ATPase [Faecalibacterium sp.]